MKTGANIHLRADGRYEARYIKTRNEEGKIVYGYCYGKTYTETEQKRNRVLESLGMKPKVKQMNLLILGAGGQGQVVKELAQNIGIFRKIDFLDDDADNQLAIGRCSDCSKFVKEYPVAIPSVGDHDLRMKWIDMLVKEGFVIPTLVHRTAIVSPSAWIDYGTVVEAKVTIGANTKIGYGCIISSGVTIDRNIDIPDGAHIDCGMIVKNEN